MLVDSHCHLFDIKGYSLPPDIWPVVVGYSPGSNRKAVEAARGASGPRGYPFVLGIAPQTAIREDLASLDSWVDFIRENRPNAIGEVGLDYKWARNLADVEKQQLVFRRMIDLSEEMKLPLVIHSRNNPNDNEVPKNAVDDILRVLEGRRFVLHFFSGDEEQAGRAVAMGGYISVTHMRSKERRKVINTVPLDRLLVESDAPFVGRTPESIREAVSYIAEIKNLDARTVGEQTTKNAMAFFGFEV